MEHYKEIIEMIEKIQKADFFHKTLFQPEGTEILQAALQKL